MYTKELIDELISCPKKIVDSPKEKDSRSSYRKKYFTLTSLDGNYTFSGFITENLNFAENFSIGLVYNPKEEKGTIILLRCNGPHGLTKISHHAISHIHTATAERINSGQKSEGHIELTEEYSTFESALQFYIKHINLLPADRQKYFPPPSGQFDMFNDDQEI
jgi:hypothetical protein